MHAKQARRFEGVRRPRLEPLESRFQLSTFAFGPIATFPGQVPPRAVAPTVSNQSGFATVQVDRTGHDKEWDSTDQVQVTTSGGTGQAGVDYAPIGQTLTFKPGETEQTVIVPLLNSGKVSGQETVNLTLSSKDGSTSAPVLQNEVLTIPNQSTAGPPFVEGLSPVVKHHEIVQLQVTFDKPMNVASVQDPANYWAQLENINNNDGYSSNTLPFRSATYDPATLTVTLTPEKPFKTSTVYNLWSPANSSPGAGIILDAEGNALGENTTEFGAGSTFTYPWMPEGCLCGSSEWRYVSMDLSGPGTMIVDNGILYLVGTKPTQSVLTGINALPNDGTLNIVSPDGVTDRSRQN